VVRAEGKLAKENPRFVITNMKQSAQWLYEQVYCQRGEIENRIKELHDLHIDRTSCTSFWANQFRVLLTAAAYVLMQELRLRAAGTDCGRAQVGMLRERLLKLGTRVATSVRRMVVHLPASFPFLSTFRKVTLAFGALSGERPLYCRHLRIPFPPQSARRPYVRNRIKSLLSEAAYVKALPCGVVSRFSAPSGRLYSQTVAFRHAFSRVEMWRGSLGWPICFRPFRLPVPHYPDLASVSTSRSSNRTGAIHASGSRRKHHAFAHGKLAVRWVSRAKPNLAYRISSENLAILPACSLCLMLNHRRSLSTVCLSTAR
jgi:hypothetical protein